MKQISAAIGLALFVIRPAEGGTIYSLFLCDKAHWCKPWLNDPTVNLFDSLPACQRMAKQITGLDPPADDRYVAHGGGYDGYYLICAHKDVADWSVR